MIREVVPYVDATFRTLSDRDSRGIVGDYMGGYGAIWFGHDASGSPQDGVCTAARRDRVRTATDVFSP